MYWRPQLSVIVAPGAEGRFTDLQTLLADSGLEVKSAAQPPVQAAKPQDCPLVGRRQGFDCPRRRASVRRPGANDSRMKR